jgi:hypothetical protein
MNEQSFIHTHSHACHILQILQIHTFYKFYKFYTITHNHAIHTIHNTHNTHNIHNLHLVRSHVHMIDRGDLHDIEEIHFGQFDRRSDGTLSQDIQNGNGTDISTPADGAHSGPFQLFLLNALG